MPVRKDTTEPSTNVHRLSAADCERGIKRLRRRLDELRALDPTVVRYNDAAVTVMERDIRDAVREVFGESSPEFGDNRNHRIRHGLTSMMAGEEERQAAFVAGISQSVTMLNGLVKRLSERLEEAQESTESRPAAMRTTTGDGRTVFVVHGRDEAAKEATARFLDKLGLRSVILHEAPNRGRTLMEKFETNADVDFAVVLLTPDDEGHPVGTQGSSPRARQNVLLELGYFLGRLGRERVCALHKGSVELPSDFDGVAYVPMDDNLGWQLLLGRELKAAGLDVDLNLAM